MREAHTVDLAPTGACRYAERRSADWLAQLSAQLDEATLALEALPLFSAVGFVDIDGKASASKRRTPL